MFNIKASSKKKNVSHKKIIRYKRNNFRGKFHETRDLPKINENHRKNNV